MKEFLARHRNQRAEVVPYYTTFGCFTWGPFAPAAGPGSGKLIAFGGRHKMAAVGRRRASSQKKFPGRAGPAGTGNAAFGGQQNMSRKAMRGARALYLEQQGLKRFAGATRQPAR